MDFMLNAQYDIICTQKLKNNLIELNKKSCEYGLILNEKDADMIIQSGKDALISTQRIEFGKSIITEIIEKFMKSSYISQENYAETIADLIDVFYNAKEESMDILTDSEIIDIMFNFFENESGGSIEILQNRDMDSLCKKIRYTANNIADDDYDSKSEEKFNE